MKPRIRWSAAWRVWECMGADGLTAWGNTPAQAYDNWAARQLLLVAYLRQLGAA